MTKVNIIRAWKDQNYRLSLTAEQLAQVPDSPAGAIDLSDSELDSVAGANTELLQTVGCCNGLTTNTCTCTWGPSCTVTLHCSWLPGCSSIRFEFDEPVDPQNQ